MTMEESDNESNNSDNSSESNDENNGDDTNIIDDEVDNNTLRIMISTDNHLGYLERDAVRGLDSFAALEEVLRLAKQTRCDLVLLSGDLFHDNKPSRRTYHKAMDILRRYCMGPDPVLFRIISDPKANFKKNVNQSVNYEDPYYSVDLPIFSIHGNHDDPTRDGGTETDMLAALDLLSVTNLVNYFGTIEQVDNVNISPILINKGTTNVALYGMGNVRDERLNRMWQGKKVRFLKPTEESNKYSQDEEEGNEGTQNPFFNIFALHQNRDLGRGSKNCVHESMIPEWMDLVVWGHEHECQIDVTESLVGTFRITQPGSSVATSLVHGEAVRKRVGILDIRGHQFRLNTIPLTQVRPFAMSEISLNNQPQLDPDDPKIDEKVTEFLTQHVDLLIEEARKKAQSLMEDSNPVNVDQFARLPEQKYKLKNPKEVLVRLKVEHSGFTTLNNQRFGARFVGQIANPSDILLFHRRRQTVDGKNEATKSKNMKALLEQPIPPAELIEMNVEDLIKDNLKLSEKHLDLLDEHNMAIALEHFVDKEQKRAIDEIANDTLAKQQKKLIKRGFSRTSNNDEDYNAEQYTKLTTAAGVREICQAESKKAREKAEKEERASLTNKKIPVDDKSEDSDNNDVNLAHTRVDPKISTSSKNTVKSTVRKKAEERNLSTTIEINEYEENTVSSAASKESKRKLPTTRKTRSVRRNNTASQKRTRYNYDDDDDSDGALTDPSDASEEDREVVSPPKRGTRKTKASTRANSPRKLTSSRMRTSRPTRRRAAKISTYEEESDDDNNDDEKYVETMKTWGTANSQSRVKRGRR